MSIHSHELPSTSPSSQKEVGYEVPTPSDRLSIKRWPSKSGAIQPEVISISSLERLKGIEIADPAKEEK